MVGVLNLALREGVVHVILPIAVTWRGVDELTLEIPLKHILNYISSHLDNF